MSDENQWVSWRWIHCDSWKHMVPTHRGRTPCFNYYLFITVRFKLLWILEKECDGWIYTTETIKRLIEIEKPTVHSSLITEIHSQIIARPPGQYTAFSVCLNFLTNQLPVYIKKGRRNKSEKWLLLAALKKTRKRSYCKLYTIVQTMAAAKGISVEISMEYKFD